MIGFIGTGNMGGALVRAAAKAADPSTIYIANRTLEKSRALAAETGCKVSTAAQIAQQCELIFLGVKPQGMQALLGELAPVLAKRTAPFVLVSMAAGLKMEVLQELAGCACPVIRMMPNTPVGAGAGVILFDCTENVPQQAQTRFLSLFSGSALCDRLPEKLIDAGTSVAGCGPAFACLFVEALAEGAQRCGLPQEKAIAYTAQMLLGTGKLILQSGKAPAQLRQEVCSPGGSTIEGVKTLLGGGFCENTAQAVQASYKRNIELGEK